jgi:hypothetical protein
MNLPFPGRRLPYLAAIAAFPPMMKSLQTLAARRAEMRPRFSARADKIGALTVIAEQMCATSLGMPNTSVRRFMKYLVMFLRSSRTCILGQNVQAAAAQVVVFAFHQRL